jgi:transposase-like protein
LVSASTSVSGHGSRAVVIAPIPNLLRSGVPTSTISAIVRPSAAQGRRRLPAGTALGDRYRKLVDWVEETIEETFTFYRLPRQHHEHLKSTNMLERLNEKIKRRTHVVRIFPNTEACLRPVRALAVETHENWLEAHRYLNMDDLREHKKTHLRGAA